MILTFVLGALLVVCWSIYVSIAYRSIEGSDLRRSGMDQVGNAP